MLKTTTSTETSTGSSIEDAANAFAGILAGDTDNQDEREAQQVEGQEPETEELETEVEDDQPEGEEGQDEDEGELEEDEDQDDDRPAAKTYTVKVDGEEVEVDEDELLKGYSRTQDYTRKTQALAEQRKAAEAELAQVRAERQQYAQLLGVLQEQLTQAVEPPTNWQHLRESDPIEYAAKWADYQQRQQQLQAIQFEQQRVQATAQQEQQAQLAQLLQQERQLTVKAIPEWSDPKTAKREKAELIEFGRKIGFSDDELAGITDHRAVVALRKAYLYDKLADKKTQVQGKITTKQTLAPGSATAAPTPKTRLVKAKQRLAQTGRVEDAASAFEQILKR